MTKLLLLLCFVPLALAGMDSMESYDDYKMEGYGDYYKDKDDDKPCTKDHDHSDDYGYRAKMMAYFKMMMMNKFHEKMHEKMDEKKDEKKEEYEKFHKWYAAMKEMKEKKEKEEKLKMMMLWQQKMELMKKKKAHEEFEELVKSFQEKKHKFVFGLTFEFLKLCKCGEISAKMNSFFTMGHKGNDFMDDMGGIDALKAMESGDMKALAAIIKKLTPEQHKKLFFGGLIKSMCGGAKSFIMYAQKFEEQMNMRFGNSTMSPPTGTT